eukprot:g13414.t1
MPSAVSTLLDLYRKKDHSNPWGRRADLKRNSLCWELCASASVCPGGAGADARVQGAEQ